MLSFLQIRDFAIIEAIELDLKGGLTALTGETGAGKSIMVDALLLAVGGRAAPDSVRHGAERAEVTATFDVRGQQTVRDWLEEQAIDCDSDDCVLRRVLSPDARNRAFINGQSVPLQSLRALGELLIDIHGQQEFQSLVRRAAQRQLLDAHGRHEALLQKTRQAYEHWSELKRRHDELTAAGRDREARLELLRYQVRELEALALKPGELPELFAEQRRLSNSGRLAEGARQALDLLYEDEFSAQTALARAQTSLKTLTALDERLCNPARLLEESSISLREAADELRHYLDRMDIDPRRQEQVERRVATLEELARKHRVPAEELPQQFERLENELRTLEAHGSELGTMVEQLQTAYETYTRAATALTKARRNAAKDLGATVTTLMQKLGMPGGNFEIAVAPTQTAEPGADGLDTIEFMVSANPGQPLRPLARVASGGELSRISLAIQVAAAHTALTPCLVFDEVDAGVGGAVAEIVGRQLRSLGERAQVLCVTHLPQVASQAHHHLRVTKLTDGRTTRTGLTELCDGERVEELARMLGGIQITTKTRDHAREMLKSAETPARKRSRSS